jgi:hypothetical protein
VGHKLPDKKQVKVVLSRLYRFLTKKARITRNRWKKKAKREEKRFLHPKGKEKKEKSELFCAKKGLETFKSVFLCKRTKCVYL